MKDLSKLGRDLKNVIIVDNTPTAYLLNQDNAIPIKSWYSDINDSELLKLIPVLISLSNVDDVREHIKSHIKTCAGSLNGCKSSRIIFLPNTVEHKTVKLDHVNEMKQKHLNVMNCTQK